MIDDGPASDFWPGDRDDVESGRVLEQVVPLEIGERQSR